MRYENRPRYRVNQYIRLPEVQVIDDTGRLLGVMPTSQALQLAHERGLDLVEVNPTQRPPITKIMDYGQFKYKQQKIAQAQKVKAKKVEVKGVRISFKIGEHDWNVRLKQAQRFLEDGHKVRLEMVLRGRERAHSDLAVAGFNRFVADLGEGVYIEVPLGRQGGRMNLQIAKRKVEASKTKEVANLTDGI
ncbi:MAG: translation initiation factor IF-3 [Candidatus Kerfeldbacteria bacterium]|nr:translation initiation factor IF-3 [Candidatus Kerfeldbacteria bacterium]